MVLSRSWPYSYRAEESIKLWGVWYCFNPDCVGPNPHQRGSVHYGSIVRSEVHMLAHPWRSSSRALAEVSYFPLNVQIKVELWEGGTMFETSMSQCHQWEALRVKWRKVSCTWQIPVWEKIFSYICFTVQVSGDVLVDEPGLVLYRLEALSSRMFVFRLK